jgi:hypothetical protein
MKSGQLLVNLTKYYDLQIVIEYCDELMTSLSTDFVDKLVITVLIVTQLFLPEN